MAHINLETITHVLNEVSHLEKRLSKIHKAVNADAHLNMMRKYIEKAFTKNLDESIPEELKIKKNIILSVEQNNFYITGIDEPKYTDENYIDKHEVIITVSRFRFKCCVTHKANEILVVDDCILEDNGVKTELHKVIKPVTKLVYNTFKDSKHKTRLLDYEPTSMYLKSEKKALELIQETTKRLEKSLTKQPYRHPWR